MVEKRIDPEDGNLYTWEEVQAFWKGKYKKKEIAAYWEECKLPKKERKKASGAKAKAGSKGSKSPDRPEPKAKAKAKAKVKAKKEGGGDKAASKLPETAASVAAMGVRSYPKGDKPTLGYGTAGFRTKAEVLDHVMYRMGLLAALRSRVLGGKTVGVMITASHNPECDNGVKLVDPLGDMLPISWEMHATKMANAADAELGEVFSEIAKEVGADKRTKASVVVGRDTRKSGPALALAAIDGVGVVQPSSVHSLGVVSTPQLHYTVRCQNTRNEYGKPSIEGYFAKLIGSYKEFLKAVDAAGAAPKKYEAKVRIDCANGVGAKVMEGAVKDLEERLPSLSVVNRGEGELNKGCGADFVKVQQTTPQGMDSLAAGERGVAFDGDADRVVYFIKKDGQFKLLDGDRIATLLASYIAEQLKKCGIEGLRLGIVQTAYANGAATAQVAKQIAKENIVCTPTGVKHLHHAAVEMDVGVYFEANGHGTVIFSKKAVAKIKAAARSEEKAAAAKQLLLMREIINETVGDAFSDFLAVEAVLYASDMSAEDWLAEYDDLPQRQMKVAVKDRSVFETTNAERTCVKPDGLQAKIDELVAAAGPSARSFVRPSGTEDVVRVYAEAATQAAMEDLATKVAQAVYDLANGVGARP
eukprot:TRINITY_DN22809_c0_g2_i1.p1 TRINITY_DN22809_c0_g2~~TRINITY_DN22809_c0_g2_i1.p1  ORF type:complete len:642 (+),score=228.79 TRINITY_DN22809_c0_g2_i1:66-1991(+)